MTPDLVDAVIDVHLKGAFNVTRPAFVKMREQGYGRIVNTSSSAGIFGNFGQTNYGAAKMGLVGFSNVLAIEGAKYNIKANSIAPLAFTRMTEDLLGPVGDKLGPEFIAPLVAYLVHESCDVTGRVFSVGGGRIAEVFIAETLGLRRPRAHARVGRRELGRDHRPRRRTPCRRVRRKKQRSTPASCADVRSNRAGAVRDR